MFKNEFWTKSTGEDYKQMWNEYDDFVLHIVEIASVEKIFKNLDFAKASRIDQISFKLLKEGALNSCGIRDLYCYECLLSENSSWLLYNLIWKFFCNKQMRDECHGFLPVWSLLMNCCCFYVLL